MLMLLIIAYQPAVAVPKSHHIHVLILPLNAGSVDDIVGPAPAEPIRRPLYHPCGSGAVAVQQAAAYQPRAAPFCVSLHSGRIHIDDFMLQVTDHHRTAIPIDYALEIVA